MIKAKAHILVKQGGNKMKKINKTIMLILTLVMIINSFSLYDIKVNAKEEQIFGKICPECKKECGYTAEIDVEATCVSPARYLVHCNTIKDIAPHDYGLPNPDNHLKTELKKGIPATCENRGYTDAYYCIDCKKLVSGYEYIDPLSPDRCHKYNISDSCTADKTVYDCPICGDHYEVSKEPKEHMWGEWKIAKEPTCTETGTEEIRCESCNELSCTREIPARGHQWTNWTITQPPTETVIRTCKVCKKSDTNTVSAIAMLDDIQMKYKDKRMLIPEILSFDGSEIKHFKYTSSDKNVVNVDENSGEIEALHTGSAFITLTAEDENGIITEDTCTVTVSYAWWQWIIRILLLGFLWY